MKLNKLSNQKADKINITKLSKCNKISKAKNCQKNNVKKVNLISVDSAKSIKKLKINNNSNVNGTNQGKKRKHIDNNEHSLKTKEKNKILNNLILPKPLKNFKHSSNNLKQSLKRQLGQFYNVDKLKHHNYSKSPQEWNHQEKFKEAKKAKLKPHTLKEKKNNKLKGHVSKITNEKKQNSQLKFSKDIKFIKQKNHILKLSKKTKMKQNYSKELKNNSISSDSKIANKSLHEQLSKMKLSCTSSLENKDTATKIKKENICNGILNSSEKIQHKPAKQYSNLITCKKEKCKILQTEIKQQKPCLPKEKCKLQAETAQQECLSNNTKNINTSLSSFKPEARCHRLASLNATAKVHILLENEFRKDKQKRSTSFLNNVSSTKTTIESKINENTREKISKKSSVQCSKNGNIFSNDKEGKGSKHKLHDDDAERSDTRRSKRMASMNAQAILAVTCSLRRRQRINTTTAAIKKQISLQSSQNNLTEPNWSSGKLQEIRTKANCSISSQQCKSLTADTCGTKILNNCMKNMNLNKLKWEQKAISKKSEEQLMRNNLCNYTVLSNNSGSKMTGFSRLGLAKFAKFTKLQVNTKKEREEKITRNSNNLGTGQQKVPVMNSYRWQSFRKSVPNRLTDKANISYSGHYLLNPALSYSYPGNSDLVCVPSIGVDRKRDFYPGNGIVPSCGPSSPVSCNMERCDCQQDESYFQQMISPYCNHKAVCPIQSSSHSSQHQTVCLPYSREQNLPSSVSEVSHHTDISTGPQRICFQDKCPQPMSNISDLYNDISKSNNQSCQQTYPNQYSYNVHNYQACQLNKYSFPFHDCRTPNHIHRHHQYSSLLHPKLNYQKTLVSHNKDISCPPAPHSLNPSLRTPSPDSAASLAAKVSRPELFVPQEANLPTEGKLSVEDGSYKYCLSCQETVCEKDIQNVKCVPSCKPSLLNCSILDKSDTSYLNSSKTIKLSKSGSKDFQLDKANKITNCKVSSDKTGSKHFNSCYRSASKSFKFLKLNQKWRRSESPEDDIPLCNLNRRNSTPISTVHLGSNSNAEKSARRYKKQNSVSKFSNKKSCNKETDSTNTKIKTFENTTSKFISSQSVLPTKLGKKRFSNGWSWEGESFEKLVLLNNDDVPRLRKCYPAMRHMEGDIIRIRDCVLLKSGPRKVDLPFVAKIVALWENADDGEMMVSLLWYYRPEHTEQGRKPHHMEDEIFASKHRDVNSVACIEDKCYVLTFGEYCRYRAWLKMLEEGSRPKVSPVPDMEECYNRRDRLPPGRVSSDMLFFCHKVYDFRQKRILKNPT